METVPEELCDDRLRNGDLEEGGNVAAPGKKLAKRLAAESISLNIFRGVRADDDGFRDEVAGDESDRCAIVNCIFSGRGASSLVVHGNRVCRV